jgi:cation:H+ antiporter
MLAIALIWLQFVACVAVIATAGTRLCRYGDAIAALTGLSRNWIGLIMVATVTSLPELVTGLSAVTVADVPDIAVGDALGSCVFNLALLAIVDLLHRKGPIYATAGRGHIASAGFGVVLLTWVGLAIVLTAEGTLPTLGHVSAASIAILLLYLFAMRALFAIERACPPIVRPAPTMTLRTALRGYAVASAIIIAAGIWLPLVSIELAKAMGWSDSFVGTLFVALATSTPEIATVRGAVSIGAIDMAIANVLGSNLFDVMILALDDLAYLPGPIYAHVSPVHAVSALTASMMTGAVIVALAHCPERRILRTASWTGIVLLVLYLLHAAVQYRWGQ